MRPDRVVIGCKSEKAKNILRELYRPLYLLETPIIFTQRETDTLGCFESLWLRESRAAMLRMGVPCGHGAAMVLGVGVAMRMAVGMAVTLAVGTVAVYTSNMFLPAQTMTAYIAQRVGGDLPFGEIGYLTIFAVGLYLFISCYVCAATQHSTRAGLVCECCSSLQL